MFRDTLRTISSNEHTVAKRLLVASVTGGLAISLVGCTSPATDKRDTSPRSTTNAPEMSGMTNYNTKVSNQNGPVSVAPVPREVTGSSSRIVVNGHNSNNSVTSINTKVTVSNGGLQLYFSPVGALLEQAKTGEEAFAVCYKPDKVNPYDPRFASVKVDLGKDPDHDYVSVPLVVDGHDAFTESPDDVASHAIPRSETTTDPSAIYICR